MSVEFLFTMILILAGTAFIAFIRQHWTEFVIMLFLTLFPFLGLVSVLFL
jgi:hypothetical protein